VTSGTPFAGTDISSEDLRRQIARLNSLQDLRVYIHDALKIRAVDFLSHLAKLTRLELDRISCPAQVPCLEAPSQWHRHSHLLTLPVYHTLVTEQGWILQ